MSDDFLCRRVLHSQPQPAFQYLQVAEQDVIDLIAYQRRMGFIRCAAAVQALCQFPQLIDESGFFLPFLGFIGFWGHSGRSSIRELSTRWYHRHPNQ